MNAPFQSEVIARNREAVRMSRKKRYRGVIGLGLGGAGLAAAVAGLPISVSLVLWLAGVAAWAILRGV